MRIRCPNCPSLYRIPDERIPSQGARATCKSCGARIDIPAPGTVEPPALALRTGAGMGLLPMDPQSLADLLLVHQNNLGNLRVQARQAGNTVPFYVLNGIEHELSEIRRIDEAMGEVVPPLRVKFQRLPEPGEVQGEDKVVERFPLLIGRSSVCGWRLETSQISQFHGRMLILGGELHYQDLGSTNGGALVRGGMMIQRFDARALGDTETAHLPVPLQPRDMVYVAGMRVIVAEIGEASQAHREGLYGVGEQYSREAVDPERSATSYFPNMHGERS